MRASGWDSIIQPETGQDLASRTLTDSCPPFARTYNPVMGRITAYQPADAGALAAIFAEAHPSQRPSDIGQRLDTLVSIGGQAWVLAEVGSTIGYAAVSPVDGLDGVMNLGGFIRSDRRRQGAGSGLLAHLLDDLKKSNVRQISHSVTDLDSAAAHFLRHHQFFIEHEEQLMRLDDLDDLSPPPEVDLRRFAGPYAIRLFSQLYTKSFSGSPWFQPYSEAEAAATLDKPEDMSFLFLAGTPIGFIWTHLSGEGLGEIEPLGIIAGYQGKGHGRALLLAGLHQLARRGAREVSIGAWRDNQVANRLYESVGFRRVQIFSYLAFDLQ